MNRRDVNKTLSWDDAQTFLAVAEHHSFSAAARALGVGQPTISRRIQNLEHSLQQQLFERGKHGAVPTEAAQRLFPAAEQMAKWAAEFDRSAQGAQDSISGTVKIAAPPGIAVAQLAPFAAQLQLTEPDITLEILSAIDHVDLTRGSADIALRTQPPNEPELVSLQTVTSQPGVYASRAYADSVAQPCHWQDLDWITWSGRYRNVSPRPMLEKLIPDFRPVFSSDDYLVQLAAAEAGVGAFITGMPIGFETSELVEIDVGVTLPESNFYIVCAKSMQQVPRVRVVIERLVACLTTTKR